MQLTTDNIEQFRYDLLGGSQLVTYNRGSASRGNYDVSVTIAFNRSLSSATLFRMYALTALKNNGAMFGMQILASIRDMSNSDWNISHGSFYPAMRKLVEERLIVVSNAKGDKYCNKKYYEITALGEEYLDEHRDSFKREVASSGSFFSNMMKEID